jgi:hypothetical protein
MKRAEQGYRVKINGKVVNGIESEDLYPQLPASNIWMRENELVAVKTFSDLYDENYILSLRYKYKVFSKSKVSEEKTLKSQGKAEYLCNMRDVEIEFYKSEREDDEK